MPRYIARCFIFDIALKLYISNYRDDASAAIMLSWHMMRAVMDFNDWALYAA